MSNSSPASFTLLVNSSDGFEDCWVPFFSLLARYWPAPLPPILLNTERKSFTFPGLDIRCTQVQVPHARRLTWSECLHASLLQVETPLVLYMQEDYFIEGPVDLERIGECTRQMLEDSSIRHVGLTHFGAGSPIEPDARAGLSRIGSFATYRISTQAGLWRTETLKSYLLPWESGWMFELLGTIRSWLRKEVFLTLDRSETTPSILYQHTGIIKGKWSRFVPDLFKRHGLDLDYERRGFYDSETSSLKRKLALFSRVVADPAAVVRSLRAGISGTTSEKYWNP